MPGKTFVDDIVLCQLSENLRFFNSSLTISNINSSGVRQRKSTWTLEWMTMMSACVFVYVYLCACVGVYSFVCKQE